MSDPIGLQDPSPPRAAAPAPALASLDLLRGTMPWVVLMSHAAIWTGALRPLKAFFIGGGLAVDIFIFISGFLMFWHYRAREGREPWHAPSTWTRFWLRRVFRMAPLYWLVLTLVYLAHPQLEAWSGAIHESYPPPWHGRVLDPQRVDTEAGPANLIAHYCFVFGLIPKFAANNPLPDWSIGLEMQFYLCFPFLALAIARFGWAWSAAVLLPAWWLCTERIATGLLEPAGPWGWFPMPSFLPLRLGVFLSGMLAAEALRASGKRITFLGCAATSMAVAGWHNRWMLPPVAGFLLWEWLQSPGNRMVVAHGWLNRGLSLGRSLLGARPVAIAADCSYGVYLWHMPLQITVMHQLMASGILVEMGPITRWSILCALVMPMVLALSFLTHRFVEQPGIALGKSIVRRIPVRANP